MKLAWVMMIGASAGCSVTPDVASDSTPSEGGKADGAAGVSLPYCLKAADLTRAAHAFELYNAAQWQHASETHDFNYDKIVWEPTYYQPVNNLTSDDLRDQDHLVRAFQDHVVVNGHMVPSNSSRWKPYVYALANDGTLLWRQPGTYLGTLTSTTMLATTDFKPGPTFTLNGNTYTGPDRYGENTIESIRYDTGEIVWSAAGEGWLGQDQVMPDVAHLSDGSIRIVRPNGVGNRYHAADGAYVTHACIPSD